METTEPVITATEMDTVHTGLECSLCGPVSVLALPIAAVRQVRAAARAHRHAAHPSAVRA